MRTGLVPRMRGMRREQIARDADDFLRRYYPQLITTPGPLNVIDAFERVLPDHYQLETGVEDLEEGVEGEANPDGKIIINHGTYLDALVHKDGRARFTIMHECYHGIKHIRQIKAQLQHRGSVLLYRGSVEGVPIYENPEWQADEFASAVLMPAQSVMKVTTPYRHSFTLCTDLLTDVFQVSVQAARVRLSKLGLFNNRNN